MPNGETVPAETFSALQSTKLTSAVLVGSSIDTAQNAERVRRQAQGRARAFSTFFLVQGAEPQARPPSHYSPFQTFYSGLSLAAPCPSYVCVHRLSFHFTLLLKGGLEFVCTLSHRTPTTKAANVPLSQVNYTARPCSTMSPTEMMTTKERARGELAARRGATWMCTSGTSREGEGEREEEGSFLPGWRIAFIITGRAE